MDQTSAERAPHPVAERAAELGERVGLLTSLALRRIEAMARSGMPAHGAPGAAGTLDPASTDAPGTTGRSATDRAEAILDGAGERISQMASVAGPGLRRFVALAREEAEDIWADAQEIRRSNRRGPG